MEIENCRNGKVGIVRTCRKNDELMMTGWIYEVSWPKLLHRPRLLLELQRLLKWYGLHLQRFIDLHQLLRTCQQPPRNALDWHAVRPRVLAQVPVRGER